jgi:DNA mismatch endonuclease (patch repair protein)
LPKLARNTARDAEHLAQLAELRWDVLVIWECEVAATDRTSERVRTFLE